MKKSTLVVLIVLTTLIIDQALKIWIKTNMHLNEEFEMLGFNWAKIHFIENEGMAFGLELGGDYGKLALSIFRIIAISFLTYYIGLLIQKKANTGLLVCFALILAGAIGNMIDSAFYGLIFTESHLDKIARIFPPEGGYATFLHGKVVDMFHFPIMQGTYPEWVPFLGGKYMEFFRPVFNVADSAITVGVISILLFQRSFFSNHEETPRETAPAPFADNTEERVEA